MTNPGLPPGAYDFQILKSSILLCLQRTPEFACGDFKSLLRQVITENPQLQVFEGWQSSTRIKTISYHIGSYGELKNEVYGRNSNRKEIVESIVKEILQSTPCNDLCSKGTNDLYREAQERHPKLGWESVNKKAFKECIHLGKLKEEEAVTRENALRSFGCCRSTCQCLRGVDTIAAADGAGSSAGWELAQVGHTHCSVTQLPCKDTSDAAGPDVLNRTMDRPPAISSPQDFLHHR